MSVAESRKEIASRIVNNWKENHFISALNMREHKLITLIEFALKDRDERAAKIAQTHFDGDNHRNHSDRCDKAIARAIRDEDTNA